MSRVLEIRVVKRVEGSSHAVNCHSRLFVGSVSGCECLSEGGHGSHCGLLSTVMALSVRRDSG